MQLKKAEKHDLEKRKFGLTQLGLIVACSLALVAFEYGTIPGDHTADQFTWEAEDLAILDQALITVVPKKPQPKKVIVNLELPPKIEDKVEEPEEKEELKEKPDPFLGDIDPSFFDEEADSVEGHPSPTLDFVDEMPYWYTDEFVVPKARANYTKRELELFLSRNVKYPSMARDRGEQGTVHISFVVSATGEITRVKIAKSSGSKMLDAEALRATNKLPNFIPGKQQGIPQHVRMHLPVRFTLR